MTLLPIVARELRVASRRHSTYWTRALAALVVLLVATWCFLVTKEQAQNEIAMTLFAVLTGSAVLYCLFAGVQATADCISREKREGTLGLLFLTDLKGYDIVAGKLVATSLNSFYAVLGVVPMLGVPLILGGVTAGEFGRMTLLVVNTLFLSLAIGIGVSAMSRSARNAVFATSFLIILFAALLPFCGFWLQSIGKLERLSKYCFLPSAGFGFFSAFDLVYSGRAEAESFWRSALTMHGLGWIFIVVACVVTPRTWQDRGATFLGSLLQRWRAWNYGASPERAVFRKRLLDQSAFYWLAARARLKPAFVWATFGLMACVWLWGLAKYRHDWLGTSNYLTCAILLNALLKNWIASEAGRQLAEERQQGTLELLLSTPLTVKDILHGQRLALLRQFLGPVVAVLALEGVFALASMRDAESQDDRSAWLLFWLAFMLMLPLDCLGIYWVGMWQGITGASPQRAARATKVRILVSPWIGLMLIALVASLASLRSQSEAGGRFYVGLWFALGLTADLAFSAYARARLLYEFRSAATQRFTQRPSLWRRIIGSS